MFTEIFDADRAKAQPQKGTNTETENCFEQEEPPQNESEKSCQDLLKEGLTLDE